VLGVIFLIFVIAFRETLVCVCVVLPYGCPVSPVSSSAFRSIRLSTVTHFKEKPNPGVEPFQAELSFNLSLQSCEERSTCSRCVLAVLSNIDAIPNNDKIWIEQNGYISFILITNTSFWERNRERGGGQEMRERHNELELEEHTRKRIKR